MPDDVLAFYREAGARGRRGAGTPGPSALEARLPGGSQERQAGTRQWRGQALAGFEQKLPTWKAGEKLATRAALKSCLNAVVPDVPGLVSGGADLTGNTGTMLDGEPLPVQGAPRRAA